MASAELILGTGEDFLDHEMDADLRSQHLHVLGATGTGKSRFLLSLILQDIKQNRGLCLVDPHGELVEHVLDWISNNEVLANRRKIRVLDLKDQDWSFGFNPLHADDEYRIEAVVDQAVSAMASVMGGEDLTQTPLLRLSLNAVCIALAYSGLTLNEALYLLKPDYEEERLAITGSIKDPTYAKVWDGLNRLAEKQPRMYIEQFQAAERRFIPFIANRFIRSILSQSENTIDLKQSMDDGEILLVNLSREGGYVPAESSRIIGRLLVNNLVAKAYERPVRNVRPFNLYIDEVQNYLSGDIPEILSQCRKFGLHLTLAHQYLQQLREAGDLVYHGVMGTARNKVVFALDNPEDAETMQRRIFVGQYDFEKAKKSLIKPTVVGHEIIKLWSEGESATDSTTETSSETKTESEAFGRGFSESATSGSSTGQQSSSSDVTSMMDGDELDLTRHVQTTADTTSKSTGEGVSASQSSAKGNSKAKGESTGTTTGTTESRSYSEALRPIFEDMPTATYSLDELKHIFTDLVISLPKRHAFAVLAGEGMARIETLDVPDLVTSKSRKERIVSDLKSSSGIHKRPDDVMTEIQGRFEAFLLAQQNKDVEEEFEVEEIEFDPMKPM